MSDKKQSSIDWYANASHELIVKRVNGEITNRELLTMHHNLFYDAEAMHKEEMKEAHLIADHYPRGYEFDKWYNETFGG